MIEALMTIMSSSGLGAITGGFFGWLGRREDRKCRAADQSFELERIIRNSEANVEQIEAEAFTESQKTKSGFSDSVKSLVRPVITGFLLFMTYNILLELETITGGIQSLPDEQAAKIYRDITLNIISLTATAVSWWFASRPSSITRG